MFCRTIFILCICAAVHAIQEEKVEATASKPTNNGFAFPTECGYSPIYPRELLDGGYKIEPDEFSWLASLEYANKSLFGHCSGSVISSRYVLTSGNCISESRSKIKPIGKPLYVRLGKYVGDEMCDYGVESCKEYELFKIETIKVHSDIKLVGKQTNNIALIRLDRDITFGPKVQPICLPFGKNKIDPPETGSFLTVAGWWTTMFPSDVVAKRSESIAFWNTTACHEADLDKKTQYCGVKPGRSPCPSEFGSPLMNMFERRRMVLEGIAYSAVTGCPGQDVGTLFTQVRPYGKWIEQTIRELENPSETVEL